MKTYRVIFTARGDPRVAWLDLPARSKAAAIDEASGCGPEVFNCYPPCGSANLDEVELDQAWWDKAKPSACALMTNRPRA